VNPFRAAVEARDFEGAVALLADDVVFRSPVVFRPYEGREVVGPLSGALALAEAMKAQLEAMTD
jgi:ketosteroid isomerase-like protein